jgi:hypothetical protein
MVRAMGLAAVQQLIEGSDLKGLLAAIDNICAGRDWDTLVTLRDRCKEAVERGKQLWGIAQFAEYRLALEAPAPYLATVVKEGAGGFTLGPLWEVAAASHTWAELSPHLDEPRWRALAAHERALRGDTVDAASIQSDVVDAPLTLAPWEPTYPVAEYRPDRAAFPEREVPNMEWIDLSGTPETIGHDDAAAALLDLAEVWSEESSGHGEVRVVEGDARSAIRAFGLSRARIAQVDLKAAMALMTWVGASGGAYGRRRGSPVGRSGAWWALTCLLGLSDEGPLEALDLGVEAAGLNWFAWDPGDRVGGWSFYLAVEDPLDGLAWAVSAVDWR